MEKHITSEELGKLVDGEILSDDPLLNAKKQLEKQKIIAWYIS